jgi:hypothetical protein
MISNGSISFEEDKWQQNSSVAKVLKHKTLTINFASKAENHSSSSQNPTRTDAIDTLNHSRKLQAKSQSEKALWSDDSRIRSHVLDNRWRLPSLTMSNCKKIHQGPPLVIFFFFVWWTHHLLAITIKLHARGTVEWNCKLRTPLSKKIT